MSSRPDRMTCTIPFPPSVNHMYASNMGGRRIARYKTAAARQFMRDATILLRSARPAGWMPVGDFAVMIGLIAPDRRRRDADNHIKAVQDALQAAGIFEDDSMVVHMTIEKWGVARGGAAHVRVMRIDDGVPSMQDMAWLLSANDAATSSQ